jgi:CheY-like chemotaxis protein
MNPQQVLVIEDDEIQAKELKGRLRATGLDLRYISTELEFWDMIKHEPVLPFSLAVVDMMLRWTNPAPDMEFPPENIMEEGFYAGGLRCCRELVKQKIPCVIFTALDPSRVTLSSLEKRYITVFNKNLGYDAFVGHVISRLQPPERR